MVTAKYCTHLTASDLGLETKPEACGLVLASKH